MPSARPNPRRCMIPLVWPRPRRAPPSRLPRRSRPPPQRGWPARGAPSAGPSYDQVWTSIGRVDPGRHRAAGGPQSTHRAALSPSPTFPERQPRHDRDRSSLDPYKAALLAGWNHGCRNGCAPLSDDPQPRLSGPVRHCCRCTSGVCAEPKRQLTAPAPRLCRYPRDSGPMTAAHPAPGDVAGPPPAGPVARRRPTSSWRSSPRHRLR